MALKLKLISSRVNLALPLGILGWGQKERCWPLVRLVPVLLGRKLGLAWFQLLQGEHCSCSGYRVFLPSNPCWRELPDPCPTSVPFLAPFSAFNSHPGVSRADLPCACTLCRGGLVTFQTVCSLSSVLQMLTPLYASYSFLVSEDSISNCMATASRLHERELCSVVLSPHPGPAPPPFFLPHHISKCWIDHLTYADLCYEKQ